LGFTLLHENNKKAKNNTKQMGILKSPKCFLCM
jgi:hypothetical protein